MDRITRKELKQIKANLEFILKFPEDTLQTRLAKYWLERINRKGVYCFRE